ncbi:MAG: hypothetical protein ACXWNQ_09130 [Anaerolineales bacterium]
MSSYIATTPLSPLVWLVLLVVVVLVAFGIVRYFFGHLMHLFFRGCGLILIVIAALYVLHLLKMI